MYCIDVKKKEIKDMTTKEKITKNMIEAGCEIITNNHKELAWYTLNSQYLMKCLFDENGEIIHKLTIDLQANKVVSQW